MFSVYSLKSRFQGLLRPAVNRVQQAGVTANQVTVLACAASVALGIALCFTNTRWFLALPIFFAVRMAMNAADGMLARDFGQKSRLGAYLNELGDVISDAFLYLPFAFVPGFPPLWIAAVIFLSALSEMTGVVAVLTGARRQYNGPMGKSDRALAFSALGVWIGLRLPLAPWAAYCIPITLSLMLVLTILNRIRSGLAESNVT